LQPEWTKETENYKKGIPPKKLKIKMKTNNNFYASGSFYGGL